MPPKAAAAAEAVTLQMVYDKLIALEKAVNGVIEQTMNLNNITTMDLQTKFDMIVNQVQNQASKVTTQRKTNNPAAAGAPAESKDDDVPTKTANTWIKRMYVKYAAGGTKFIESVVTAEDLARATEAHNNSKNKAMTGVKRDESIGTFLWSTGDKVYQDKVRALLEAYRKDKKKPKEDTPPDVKPKKKNGEAEDKEPEDEAALHGDDEGDGANAGASADGDDDDDDN